MSGSPLVDLAFIGVIVVLGPVIDLLTNRDPKTRSLRVGGAVVLVITLILPIAGIAAAVLGVLLIVREQVARGVVLLVCSILVGVLAGAVWLSVLTESMQERAVEEFVPPAEPVYEPGLDAPPFDCADPAEAYLC